MIRPEDNELAAHIREVLVEHAQDVEMHGINSDQTLNCFIEQIIDSDRRIRYVNVIRDKSHDQSVCDPRTTSFDPLKAAAWHRSNDNNDEAFWLIFLAIHFGKNLRTGWGLVKGIYGSLNNGAIWTWERVVNDPDAFETWILNNLDGLKLSGKYGNHRKYESLKPGYLNRTILSYINWIGQTHTNLVDQITDQGHGDARLMFRLAYQSMNAVFKFGRMGKFDYLCMVGKMGLISIEPDSMYMKEATGPKDGAKLLFDGDIKSATKVGILEDKVNQLEAKLNLQYGMQIMEDALCNWQKSPDEFKHFAG